MRGHRSVSGPLEAQVHRGVDGEATGVDEPLALLHVAAQGLVLLEVGERVGAEERRGAVDAAVVRLLQVEAQATRLHLVGLVLADHVELGHPVQDDVTALDGALGEVGRVERTRVLHEPGQDRRLVEVEVAGVDVEVVLGSGLHAVGAIAEVDDVEVALEDPVLRVLVLEGDGVAELVELACVGVVGDGRLLLVGRRLGDEGLFDQLLGDRRPTLDDAAGGGVGEERAQGALDIESAVLVEAVVLDREQSLDHLAVDLAQPDVDPVLVEDRCDHVAVGVDDGGLLRQRGGLQLLRQVVDAVGGGACGETQDAGERDRQSGHDDPEDDGDGQHHCDVGKHREDARTLGTWPGHCINVREC